ncbi:hypothetical protein ABT354_37415 [Streptomyces sp. NPDC000594]|uniref:hypothetical protein n=1 Tax=Streptomyces sp. NPDC000594 TaxID=3154261 RepID=UPI003331D485
MSSAEFDPGLVAWCARWLGAVPVEPLLTVAQMSEVTAVRLDDGREVVVKSRPDPTGRTVTCVEVQRRIAAAGLPCAAPLTRAVLADGVAVHAEEWRPGGTMADGDGVALAARAGRLYATFAAVLDHCVVPPPLPNPEWVRYDHTDPGVWPANPVQDSRPGADSLPAELVSVAVRARARLAASRGLPCVLGHADWEAQNLRWRGDRIHLVHDWDSLAWLPEAALVGAACGAFASGSVPTLAPLAGSEAFITAYEEQRRRAFTAGERQVVWAASLWPALHNARAEVLWGRPHTALTELLGQGGERLRRAGA